MAQKKKTTVKNADTKKSVKAAPKKSAKAAPKKAAKPAPKKVAKPAPKKKVKKDQKPSFAYQLVPYIVAVVALFLLVCFISNAIANPGNKLWDEGKEKDHPLGVVGFWICQVLFGAFGPAAYVLPVILGCFVVFWKNYNKRDFVALNAVIALLTAVVLSAIVHTFTHMGAGTAAFTSDIGDLFEDGACSKGGGVVGGILAFALTAILNIGGTLFVLLAVLIPMIMFLVGTTPVDVVSFIVAKIKKAMEKSAEERRIRKEEEELDEKERREEEKAERAIRREEARAERAAQREAEREERAAAREAAKEAARAAKAKKAAADDEAEYEDEAEAEDDDYYDDTPALVGISNKEENDYDDDEDDYEEPAKPARVERPATMERAARAADRSSERANARPSAPVRSARAESFADEDEEPEEKLKISAFSTEDIRKTEGFKTRGPIKERQDANREAPVMTDDDDERGAGEVFAQNDDDSETVTFTALEGMGRRTRGYATVDDLLNERFDENGYRIDEETGEVFTPVVQDNGFKSADEYRAANEKKDEYFIGDKPTPPPVPEYVFPPIDLLEEGPNHYSTSPDEIEKNIELLRGVLQDFKINIRDIECSCGPTITRYEVKPEAGVRVRQIANLVDDISYGLAKSGIRIEAPIPGKAAVGIEVPNDKSVAVKLRSLVETPEFINHKSKLAACLGADVSGKPVIFDIEKMPHLLVAGTTGSGKSVCINSILMSILYHAKPEEVKLLLIDPKKVEFKVYRDIPHLCCRIISDPKKAAGALNSAVNEMEKRFELIEEVGVRNITGYNEVTKNDPDKPYMPRLVIIIDEFADLMMTAKDEVETAVVRIAQKARAAGIHLIIGTQRPSVDVITGLIKANIPSRIAFTVMSGVDSRTILDTVGAEKLCGRGDMLYAPVGAQKPQRVQGAFVSDEEVEEVVTFVKERNAPVRYDQEFETSIDNEAAKCGNAPQPSADSFGSSGGSGDEDSKLWDAVELAIDAGKISTSLLQRRLEVGYGRAAKIIDRMEEMGFVSAPDGNKPRKILITREELDELRNGAIEE